MEKFKQLEKIKEIYSKGGNIIKYLKENKITFEQPWRVKKIKKINPTMKMLKLKMKTILPGLDLRLAW